MSSMIPMDAIHTHNPVASANVAQQDAATSYDAFRLCSYHLTPPGGPDAPDSCFQEMLAREKERETDSEVDEHAIYCRSGKENTKRYSLTSSKETIRVSQSNLRMILWRVLVFFFLGPSLRQLSSRSSELKPHLSTRCQTYGKEETEVVEPEDECTQVRETIK